MPAAGGSAKARTAWHSVVAVLWLISATCVLGRNEGHSASDRADAGQRAEPRQQLAKYPDTDPNAYDVQIRGRSISVPAARRDHHHLSWAEERRARLADMDRAADRDERQLQELMHMHARRLRECQLGGDHRYGPWPEDLPFSNELQAGGGLSQLDTTAPRLVLPQSVRGGVRIAVNVRAAATRVMSTAKCRPVTKAWP